MSTVDDTLTTFGSRLRWARQRLEMSQADLSELLGIKQPNITLWEQDRRNPKSTTVLRLAKGLGVDPGWLAFGSPENLQSPTS